MSLQNNVVPVKIHYANHGSFVKFGAGARTCIGKNISLLELSKAIPQLVRNFEFKLVSP